MNMHQKHVHVSVDTNKCLLTSMYQIRKKTVRKTNTKQKSKQVSKCKAEQFLTSGATVLRVRLMVMHPASRGAFTRQISILSPEMSQVLNMQVQEVLRNTFKQYFDYKLQITLLCKLGPKYKMRLLKVTEILITFYFSNTSISAKCD